MTRRAERTRAELQQSFEDLLAEKPFEAITMAEIARRAGRSRVTAYRHYPDKEAMLLACFTTVIEEIKDNVVYPSEAQRATSYATYANLVTLYTHVAAHRPLYQALFTSPAGPVIRTRFRRVISGIAINTLEQEGALAKLPAPIDMVCNLLGELVVGAMVWWLETKSQHDPALLAEIVLRLAETGFFGLARQEPAEWDVSFRPFVAERRPA